MSPPRPDQVRIAVLVPYDMALDRELWRWAPDDVTLLFTRTPYSPLGVTVEMAEVVSDAETLRRAVADVSAVSPEVYAYACTSGSFVRGRDGERELVRTMRAAGAPAAVTTSGALLESLTHLGVDSVAVATPYDDEVTTRLGGFLAEAGIAVVGDAALGLTGQIWQVPYAVTADLVRRADTAAAQAVVVSCTNLATYDIVAELEAELGKPVVTANQATMWSALRVVDRAAVGPGQRLLAGG